jgi:hypothetical protein
MTPAEGSKKNNEEKNAESGGINSTRVSAVFIL